MHFSSKGYSQTSMQDITEEAGLTKGAFYHHFRSKEEILKRIHDEITDAVITACRPVVEAGTPPAQTMRELIRVQMSTIDSRGAAIAVVMRDRRVFGAENWKAIRSQRDIVENFFIDVVREGQRTGDFRKDAQPRIVAYGILGMLSWTHEWYRPGSASTSEIAETFADMVLDGLVTTPRAGGRPAAKPAARTAAAKPAAAKRNGRTRTA